MIETPETRHARDCEYVTSDGPAPCTCQAGQIAARPLHPAYGNFQLFDSASGKCVAEGSFPGALANGDTVAGSFTIDFGRAE